MTPEATRPKSGYGWKLGTFRLPTGDYMFEVVHVELNGPNETAELDLKIAAGDYVNHRIRAFLPKDEWVYENRFRARLDADYGIIVPATVAKY
jgi:hypothetical protein